MKRQKNIWPFGESRRVTRGRTPASSRSASSLGIPSRSRRSTVKASTFKGYRVIPSGEGFTVPQLDTSVFDTLTDAKRFISDELKARRNPPKGDAHYRKYARQVDRLTAQISRTTDSRKLLALIKRREVVLRDAAAEFRRNPLPLAAVSAMNDVLGYQLAGAALSKGAKYGSKLVRETTRKNAGRKRFWVVTDNGDLLNTYATKKEAERYAKNVNYASSISAKVKDSRRENPAAASAEAYKDFHGTPPSEFVTVKRKVHVHRHLAGAGTLRKLQMKTPDGKARVTIRFYSGSDPKQKTILAFNEKRNQLFVEGGDQAVNLRDFGITKPHELETLGKVLDIDYFTTKTHLGEDGGTAVYGHKFRTVNEDGRHVTVRVARYPDLIYRVLDKQLEFSGGSYEILPEGINQ